jgi:hypothetical protein
MPKTVLIPTSVLALVGSMQLATMSAAAIHQARVEDPTIHLSKKDRTTISVFTYAVGGPPHKRYRGPNTISNAVVRIRKPGVGGKLIREAKYTKNGHITFSVNPGVYQVEAALEPPAVTPGRLCGSPKVIRARKDKQTLVKLTCQIK